MTTPRRFDFETNFAALSLAALVATLSYVGLSALASPKGLSPRLAAVEDALDSATRARAPTRGGSAYPAGAVCEIPPDRAQADLKRRLQAAAAQAGLSVEALAVEGGSADAAVRGLAPLAFEIEANGRDAAVTAMLHSLSASSPALFVDALDLNSNISTVTLKLSGHIFCSTSVRR